MTELEWEEMRRLEREWIEAEEAADRAGKAYREFVRKHFDPGT